jgi:hypothetical protein
LIKMSGRHNGEKIISAIIDVGKTGYLSAK